MHALSTTNASALSASVAPLLESVGPVWRQVQAQATPVLDQALVASGARGVGAGVQAAVAAAAAMMPALVGGATSTGAATTTSSATATSTSTSTTPAASSSSTTTTSNATSSEAWDELMRALVATVRVPDIVRMSSG